MGRSNAQAGLTADVLWKRRLSEEEKMSTSQYNPVLNTCGRPCTSSNHGKTDTKSRISPTMDDVFIGIFQQGEGEPLHRERQRAILVQSDLDSGSDACLNAGAVQL